jgi:hypothetical protein
MVNEGAGRWLGALTPGEQRVRFDVVEPSPAAADKLAGVQVLAERGKVCIGSEL